MAKGNVRVPVLLSEERQSGFLRVICDDGAVFESDSDDKWVTLPPIPGTAADIEQLRVKLLAAADTLEKSDDKERRMPPERGISQRPL